MKLQRYFLLFLTILFILTLHIFVINFLPYPYNHINTVFALLLLALTINPGPQIIWSAIIISYFFELLSGTPFGIGLLSFVISFFIINWFQLNILTNRSIHIIFISAVSGMIFYRLLFFGLLAVYNTVMGLPIFPQKETIIDIGWEILFSSLLVFFLYFIYTKLLKPFRVNYKAIY